MTSSLEITQSEMKRWDNEKIPFTLIDVREKEERQAGHIGGDLLPLSELLTHIHLIPSGKVVLYCRSGARSLAAAKRLREILERDDIFSLAGGMLGHTDN
jgi:adenylyltransferase/sulfurtransferase